MGELDACRHTGDERDRVRWRQLLLSLQEASKVLAAHVLHHEKGGAVRQRAVVEDGDDGRMLKPGDDLRFACKPAAGGRVGEQIRADDLDRDVACQS